jgi:hypothetical protein
MEANDILRSIGETIGAGATVKSVYGDPVTTGERTVIPVARIKYAFGGGGGSGHGSGPSSRGVGGGGGGGRIDCGSLGSYRDHAVGNSVHSLSRLRCDRAGCGGGCVIGIPGVPA